MTAMFVASLASCHMLWLLSLAARQGFRVDSCEDEASEASEASATLARNAASRQSMTRVLVLQPRVRCIGQRQPTAAYLQDLHEQALEACLIANSVTAELRCEPRP